MSGPTKPFAVLYPGNGSPDNAVLRCLGEAGVAVVVAASSRLNANAVSRYCARSFRVPPPEKGGRAVIGRLVEIGDELQNEGGVGHGRKPVLFMLHDFAVMLASRHSQRLSQHYVGDFLEQQLMEVCNRHDRTYAAASAAGVNAPKTALWTGAPAEQLERIPTPCVVKPVSKYLAHGDSVLVEPFMRKFGVKAFEAHSSSELRRALDRCGEAKIPVVVQEHVPGRITDLVTVVLHVAGGRVSVHFAGRKIRQTPARCGTCTCGESCANADEAVELATHLLTSIGYHGIAEVEFKRDRRDGRLKLIELNPRATVFCSIAAASGVNLPLTAYEYLANGSVGATAELEDKTVVRWMDPYRDLLGSGWVSPLRWVGELRRADVLCWGGRKDPLPLLVAPVQGAAEWLGNKLAPAAPHSLRPVKGPRDAGYLDYWKDRSRRAGLTSVMWSNEDYDRLADARQKRLLDDALGEHSGKVLDFCCGTGRLSVHLARNGAQVVGIDLPCMVEAAQKANPHPRVSYVPVDALSLDFPPETFDAVVSVGALSCVCDTPEKLDAITEQFTRVLKPGGLLVTMEPFHVCPGLRRPLRMSVRAALEHFRRSGLCLAAKKPLLFQPGWLFMARGWWRAPHAVTSALFSLGEALLKVPGLAVLSDYKMLVFTKEFTLKVHAEGGRSRPIHKPICIE